MNTPAILSYFYNLTITSTNFYVFSILALMGYYFLFKKNQIPVLLTASYLFCASWDWSFLAVILVSSLVNYLTALKIDSSGNATRKRWFWLGLLLNILLLFSFKYINQTNYYLLKAFPLSTIARDLNAFHILQPIGISFYTLQAISYLVDVFRKQIPANKNFMEVSLFLAYFPKLLAGPIERAEGFFKQLHTIQVIRNEEINESLLRIFIGLSRKILISDSIMRIFPTAIFTDPQRYSALDLIFWWVIFTLIIYNDFAGYTSIARGVSGLFGIKLSPNFEQPYFSTSYIDFWNRWHISFSNWLRDYVYLPISRTMLRKNPSGKYWPNLVVPPLLTMMVSGLWHGAALHFILWGILNGLLQGLERLQKLRRSGSPPVHKKWRQVIGILSVFSVLLVINVPFKLSVAESLSFWQGLLNWSIPQALDLRLIMQPLMAAGLSFFIDAVQLPQKDEVGFLRLSKNFKVFLLSSGALLLFMATRQQASTPFIYQEF